MNEKSILVVDDQSLMLKLIVTVLKPLPYQVTAFTSPTDAAEFAGRQGGNLSLLITDLRMNTMSGFELARQVRTQCPDVKVLFMSGADLDEYDSDAPGVHGFILKPFMPADLVRQIADLLAD